MDNYGLQPRPKQIRLSLTFEMRTGFSITNMTGTSLRRRVRPRHMWEEGLGGLWKRMSMGDMGMFGFFLVFFSKCPWEVCISSSFLNDCSFLFRFRQMERSETIFIFASLGESAIRDCTNEMTCFLRLLINSTGIRTPITPNPC